MTKDKMIQIHQAMCKLLDIEVPKHELTLKELETQLLGMANVTMKLQKPKLETKEPRLAEIIVNMIVRKDDTPEGVQNILWQLCADETPQEWRLWYIKDVYQNQEEHARCYTQLGRLAKRFEKLGHRTRFDKDGYLAIKKNK